MADRNDRDFYVTPQWVIDLIVPKIGGFSIRSVIDPGAGDGRIGISVSKSFPNADLFMFDLVPQAPGIEQADFYDNKKMEALCSIGGALVVMNPPYSMMFDWVKRCCDLGAIVLALLPLTFLASKQRTKFIAENPPEFVGSICPRPSFTGRGTAFAEYAWFGWGTNRIGLSGITSMVKK